MNQIDCNIVRDLLPSYVENLTSKESNEAVTAHIENCPNCAEHLKELKQAISTPSIVPEEIDYLKKVRRKLKKSTCISVGILSLVFTGLLSGFLYFYVIGWPVDLFSTQLSYQYDYVNDTVTINGQLMKGSSVGRVKISDDKRTNKTKITVYEVMSSFINKNRDFSATLPLQDDLYVVWQERDNQHDFLTTTNFLVNVNVVQDDEYIKAGYFSDRTVYGKLLKIIEDAKDTGKTVKHEEPTLDSYITLFMPKTEHSFIEWIDSTPDPIPFEDAIFVYELDGKHMLQQYRQPLKELSSEQWNEIQGYFDSLVNWWE